MVLMLLSVAVFITVGFVIPNFFPPPNLAENNVGQFYRYDMNMKTLSNLVLFFKYGGFAIGLGVLLAAIFMKRKPIV